MLRLRLPVGASAGGDADGIWTIVGGTLRPVAGGTGPMTVIVPTEPVRLLAVPLPIAAARRRMEALPFAIEDRLAEPLDALHLALGAEVAPKTYLAGAVRHAVMLGWMAELAVAGLERAAIVPDVLLLPVPPENLWLVELAPDRALVRTPDGAGFAVPAAQFATVWKAGGSPPCIAYGLPLPGGITAAADVDTPTLSATDAVRRPALDLRQGRYARPRKALPQLWRRAAIVAAAGVAAHGAIAAADTIALRNIAAARKAETVTLLKERAPFQPVGEDVVAAATRLLPSGSAGPPDRMLPLLVRAAAALQPMAAQIDVRSLAYNASGDRLDLDVEAADLATLQRAETALRAAGLASTGGSAGTTDGRAEGKISVRDPSSGKAT